MYEARIQAIKKVKRHDVYVSSVCQMDSLLQEFDRISAILTGQGAEAPWLTRFAR